MRSACPRRTWPLCTIAADEYIADGEADRYGTVAGTELGRDGRWQVEPVGRAPYQTRLVVLRPVDAAAFNGTVVVLWNNVTAGYDNFTGGDSPEVFENGYAYVAASVQRVAVHGQPDNPQGLRDCDPGRHGSLSIPNDDYLFDIYTQVADLVAPDRPRDGLDPLEGLVVRRIIAQGASQSAGRHPAAPGGGPAGARQRQIAVARCPHQARWLPRELPRGEGPRALRRPPGVPRTLRRGGTGGRGGRGRSPRDVHALLAEAAEACPL